MKSIYGLVTISAFIVLGLGCAQAAIAQSSAGKLIRLVEPNTQPLVIPSRSTGSIGSNFLGSGRQEEEAPGPLIQEREQDDLPVEIRGVTSEDALPRFSLMDLDISPIDTADVVPEDRSTDLPSLSVPRAMRSHPGLAVQWVAPNIQYNPLYFEDVVLERYGQTYPPTVQPWASAFRFYVQGLALPYNATVDRPFSCESPLGFCRPGRPTGNQRQRLILRK